MPLNTDRCFAAALAMAAIGCASPLALAEDAPDEQPDSAIALSAQQGPPSGRPESVFDGDYVTLGLGGGIGPSYEGSDDYKFVPGPIVNGRWKGIEFQARAPGLTFDVIPDARDAKVEIIAGPSFRFRFARDGDTHDPVVEMLPDLKMALELGGSFGVGVNRVLSPYDSMSFQVDVHHDVAGAHDGLLVSPAITYFTPLSRSMALITFISADYADGDYHDYYFSVTPADSVASGLPVYDADGGWKEVGLRTVLTLDWDGNALNGGWGAYLFTSYSRMLSDAKRTPLTSIRGDADQFFAVAGISYTF